MLIAGGQWGKTGRIIVLTRLMRNAENLWPAEGTCMGML